MNAHRLINQNYIIQRKKARQSTHFKYEQERRVHLSTGKKKKNNTFSDIRLAPRGFN